MVSFFYNRSFLAVLRNQKLRGSTDDKLGNPTDFIEFGVEQFKQVELYIMCFREVMVSL